MLILDSLYNLKKSDIERARVLMTEAFFEDPMWSIIVPNLEKRKIFLPNVFGFVLTHALRYGYLFGESSIFEGLAIWSPAKYDPPKFWKLLRSGAIWKALKFPKEITKKVTEISKVVDKFRIQYMTENYPNYFYLQGLVVRPREQGQGIGSKLIYPMMSYADKNKVVLYLETDSEKNIAMYEHYGFEIVKNVKILDNSVDLSFMIRHPKRG